MQTQRIEKIDVRDNIVQPLFLVQGEKAAAIKIDGSPKAAFRKFAAENTPQPKAQFEQSLTDRFNSGSLQEDVRLKKINPHTLIHKAILENNPAVIRFLLAQGVSVDYPDQNGMSPLTIAILNCCDYAVEILLKNGANTNPKVKWNDMGLLETAIFMKDHKTAKSLIDHGVNLNEKAGNKGSLELAIHTSQTSQEYIEIALLMIEKGANIHSNEPENCPLFETILAYNGNVAILNSLIKKGVDLNMEFKKSANGGQTALTVAIAIGGSLDVIDLLVQSGADVNRKTPYLGMGNKSPLQLAMQTQQPEIVQYLLQHGAKA